MGGEGSRRKVKLEGLGVDRTISGARGPTKESQKWSGYVQPSHRPSPRRRQAHATGQWRLARPASTRGMGSTPAAAVQFGAATCPACRLQGRRQPSCCTAKRGSMYPPCQLPLPSTHCLSSPHAMRTLPSPPCVLPMQRCKGVVICGGHLCGAEARELSPPVE